MNYFAIKKKQFSDVEMWFTTIVQELTLVFYISQ